MTVTPESLSTDHAHLFRRVITRAFTATVRDSASAEACVTRALELFSARRTLDRLTRIRESYLEAVGNRLDLTQLDAAHARDTAQLEEQLKQLQDAQKKAELARIIEPEKDHAPQFERLAACGQEVVAAKKAWDEALANFMSLSADAAQAALLLRDVDPKQRDAVARPVENMRKMSAAADHALFACESAAARYYAAQQAEAELLSVIEARMKALGEWSRLPQSAVQLTDSVDVLADKQEKLRAEIEQFKQRHAEKRALYIELQRQAEDLAALTPTQVTARNDVRRKYDAVIAYVSDFLRERQNLHAPHLAVADSDVELAWVYPDRGRNRIEPLRFISDPVRWAQATARLNEILGPE